MYVKIMKTILQSSLWAEPPDVCKLWITILASTDSNGFMPIRAPGLATLSSIPLTRVREILTLLESPDPDSRTDTLEGRRLQQCPGGYIVINYMMYRLMSDPVKVRSQTAARVAAWRSRQKTKALPNVTCNESNGTKIKIKIKSKIKNRRLGSKSGDQRNTRARTTAPIRDSPDLHPAAPSTPSTTSRGNLNPSLPSSKPPSHIPAIAAIVRATSDASFTKPGWVAIVSAIASTRSGRDQLHTLIDRLEKDTNPKLAAGRDHDFIKNAARFCASELKRLHAEQNAKEKPK